MAKGLTFRHNYVIIITVKEREVINLKYVFIIHRHNGKVDRYKINQSELDFFTEFANLNKIKTIYAFYHLKAKHQYSNTTICYYEEKLRLLEKIRKFLFDF